MLDNWVRRAPSVMVTMTVLASANSWAAGQSASVPPGSLKFIPTAPQPVGSPGDWISDTDYPTASLRSNTTGIVRFALTVSTTGIPTACDVVGSSMDAELDKTTCALLMQRAQFTPAFGADGKKTTGTYRSSVRWQIPNVPQKLPVPGQMTLSFDILPDGRPANCVATAVGDLLKDLPGADPQAICANMTKFEPPLDPAGKPTKKHASVQTTITFTDAP